MTFDPRLLAQQALRESRRATEAAGRFRTEVSRLELETRKIQQAGNLAKSQVSQARVAMQQTEGDIPTALSDLDTTVTGSQLNALQAWFANLPGSAITDLDQTISATPTQAEVQAISDKLDVVLLALRTLAIITSNLVTVDSTSIRADSTSITADEYAA